MDCDGRYVFLLWECAATAISFPFIIHIRLLILMMKEEADDNIHLSVVVSIIHSVILFRRSIKIEALSNTIVLMYLLTSNVHDNIKRNKNYEVLEIVRSSNIDYFL